MKSLLHTVEKLLGFYRWHPTIALRYLPIVNFIRQLRFENEEILEVGSGGLGIAPYINTRVVGLDVSFYPPICQNLVPVKGSATRIPFTDDSFEVVVSSDMLEHLGQEDRVKAIYEMLRITGKLLCIGVPCGKEAQVQDEKLAQIYKSLHHKEFDFFNEHAFHGLPETMEIITLIEQAATMLRKPILITSRGTLSLRLREYLMRAWISENLFVNIWFRKVMLLAIPFMRRMNTTPTYRQLFFVTIKP